MTRAINDYATATGKGLIEATQAVTIAAEQGGGKLENLGSPSRRRATRPET